jgi:hypothetical protein
MNPGFRRDVWDQLKCKDNNHTVQLSQRQSFSTMKLTSALFSALLGSATAAPLDARIVAQEFDVSAFSAGCVPHGTQCS